MKYILIILLLIINAPVAAQQPTCAPRQKIIDQLAQQYKEVPIAFGILNNGSIIEILSSEKSFTFIITQPNGISCFAGVGTDFEILKVMKGQPINDRRN